MQYAICYISTAKETLQEEEIADLLEKWRVQNGKSNIKGVLLYSEGHFFQVLEGEKKAVLELFDLIKKDSRHYGIIQVVGKDLLQGSFDHYVVKNLKDSTYSKPELIEEYCESVKGMDPQKQREIKTILKSFIDTQVL